MTGCAKSKLQKSQAALRDNHQKLVHAVDLWNEECRHPTGPNGTQRSKTAICKEAGVSRFQLKRRLEGTLDKWEEARRRTKLGPENEDQLASMAEGLADRERPLTNKRAAEAATNLHSAKRLTEAGSDPVAVADVLTQGSSQMGGKWVYRWKARYADRLQTSWGSSLDSQRAAGVNLNELSDYWDTTDEYYEGCDIKDWNRYVADEIGVLRAIDVTQRVITRRGVQRQHIIQDGDRELTSIMGTICADGTSLPPFVIWKGTRFQTSWGLQDNPGEALMGHSEHGYMDSELAYDWLDWFDTLTAPKANGEPRILHLDNHGSHLDLNFCERAAERGIHVIGYPPHSTHVLQGLDRLHYGLVKRLWPQVEQRFEQENGMPVGKEHFLEVVNEVWKEVFTPENNRKAFVITGLSRPIEPWRITGDMIAPSLESSTQASAFPLPLPQPAQVAAGVIDTLVELQDVSTNPSTPQREELSEEARYALEITPRSMNIPLHHFTPRKRAAVTARHVALLNIPLCPRLDESSDRVPTSPILQPVPDTPTMPRSYQIRGDEDPPTLKAKSEALQVEVANLRAELARSHRSIKNLNAQLVVEHGLGRSLQRRLNAKSKRQSEKNKHAQRYLQKTRRRVYTSAGFRAALRADKAEASKKKLATVRSLAVAAAKAKRARWRDAQKDKRRLINAARQTAWKKDCDDCSRDSKPRPKKPPLVAKDKTPECFDEDITYAEELGKRQLSYLDQKLDSAGKGRERRQAAVARGLEELKDGALTSDGADSDSDDLKSDSDRSDSSSDA
ncbi:DDE-domain-containing protein [Phanerochaete sordida]|uniref:DDE-domain-containing protein n=1 Tax=Phanerochaete sordida TaxID=48140 RepID=A0A9P3GHN0_9APHY|nr:DDE-domain-containing protein [Phanerochaete sordida]